MQHTEEHKTMWSHTIYALYVVLFAPFIFLFITLTIFGVNAALSMFLLCVVIIFLALMLKFVVFPHIHDMYERMNKLEQNAKEYDIGTKLLIRRDLELSRANEKLREVDELKSNFISVVAHQLRTPLSGIKWTLNMLLSGDMGEMNNDQKTFLMKGYESNNRMIALVNDMLATDRIQSGKLRYGFRYIDLVDLLDNVLFEVSPNAVKRQISIRFKNKLEGLPQAYVDPESMRAVFQNLLENAIKYTIKGGTIWVDMQDQKEFLEISIRDDGIGIPADQQKNIFEKFFRARNASKHETDGTGLGLYIAKAVVEKNGGRIWFDSSEGKGTTFHFTVPIKEPLAKAQGA